MAKLALIRIAGTLAAMATCVAATSQAAAQDRQVILNNQLQLGDVIAGQTLVVEDVSQQVTVSNTATGNAISGSVEAAALLDSTQDMQGDASASTSLTLNGDTGGYVLSTTQAVGNSLGAHATGAALDVAVRQNVAPGEINASTIITGGDARLVGGGAVSAAAIGNNTALGGTTASLTGTVDQASDATIRATNFAGTRYIPARADFSTQAVANAVSTNSGLASNQVIDVRQRSGGFVEADTSANAGNAWDLAGRAHATANQAVFANQGGSLVTRTNQDNAANVRAAARVTSFDYGAANAYARGVANEVQVGNNDIYVEIDNTQINTGGVDVSAEFVGTNGYDAYVGADAVGNSVTGFACSDCQGFIQATNNQTNVGNVSAVANTVVNNQGRAVITGTNAVGNAATFYVARPGGPGY
jgi:hypothetical protein